jgi:formate hydrogenlyase subunit 3/multisubunit Na+/H+ antiporter MnhD subunit
MTLLFRVAVDSISRLMKFSVLFLLLVSLLLFAIAFYHLDRDDKELFCVESSLKFVSCDTRACRR